MTPTPHQSERDKVLDTIRVLVDYLNGHIEKANATIRCCNQHGDKEGSNRAGNEWACYYGTLQQIPKELRQQAGEP
jgi:hypothetical protein